MMQNKTFSKLIVNLFNSLSLTHDEGSVDGRGTEKNT
jgi:hypothetical protein